MPALGTPTYAALDAVLSKLGAKMKAPEVHALYLGALTSTDFGLGPQRLLDRIVGDDADFGDDAMDALGVLLGYWNTLVAEKDAGRVRLAPAALSDDPSRAELLAYATRRVDELRWHARGIDAGNGPVDLGPEGRSLLLQLSDAGGLLEDHASSLAEPGEPGAPDHRATRKEILDLIATLEGLIADLMAVSDAVRREALATFRAEAGRDADDGARIATPVRVGRNERCPCGSGKKWKRCCGAPGSVQ
jgi:hypothetical protein